MKHSPLAALVITLPLLALSCSSGSGGSAGGETPGTEQGQYAESAFGYSDPNPDAFHPLSHKRTAATRLDEGFVLFGNLDPASGQNLQAGPIQYRDDINAGSAQVSVPSADWYVGDFVVHDSTSGDLDGDGRLEPIYVGLAEGEGDHTAIRMAGWDWLSGTLDLTQLATEKDSFGGWWTGVQGVHCAAGDVDGDGTDELLVTESRGSEMQLRVIKLGHDGGIPVYYDVFTQVYSGWFGRVAVAQLDVDDALEIVIAHGTPGGPGVSADLWVTALDDLNTGVQFLENVRHQASTDVCIELVPGEYDGDPLDEIAFAVQAWVSSESIPGTFEQYNHYRTWLLSYDWDESGSTNLRIDNVENTFSPSDVAWDTMGGKSRSRFVAADLLGDGVQEVCWLEPRRDGWSQSGPFGSGQWVQNLDVFARTWDPLTGNAPLTTVWSHNFYGGEDYRGVDLAVVDDDGSGDDNLLVTVGYDAGLSGTYAYQQLVFDMGHVFNVGFLGNVGHLGVPFMAGGDYDGEGLVLEYTGVKYPSLPDPIPMVALAAPPTKSGIAQNYGLTGSSYEVSEATTQAYTVTTGLSLSYSKGVSIEDLSGSFGASMKEKLSVTASKSLGNSTTLTTSKVFNGAYDDDSIVFEGTLHMMYEYLVVGAQDPTAIGTTVSLNVPVATKVFKWTTDYYNANVDPEDQLPADLFTHTIGDPTSYPTQGALTGLLQGHGGTYEGWEGESTTVGQGGASNGIGLSMETVLTEGTSYGFGAEVEYEWKVGGPTYGLSLALSYDSLYEVSVSDTTTYSGTIGDIEQADWADWFYDVGMVVYTRADAGELPFQVLDYWTEPLGDQYP